MKILHVPLVGLGFWSIDSNLRQGLLWSDTILCNEIASHCRDTATLSLPAVYQDATAFCQGFFDEWERLAKVLADTVLWIRVVPHPINVQTIELTRPLARCRIRQAHNVSDSLLLQGFEVEGGA